MTPAFIVSSHVLGARIRSMLCFVLFLLMVTSPGIAATALFYWAVFHQSQFNYDWGPWIFTAVVVIAAAAFAIGLITEGRRPLLSPLCIANGMLVIFMLVPMIVIVLVMVFLS